MSKTPDLSISCAPPEFFPIPPRGQDRYFGLGRTSYYELERKGVLKLARIRKPGNVRGRVLVPYRQTLAALQKLAGIKPGKASAA